MIRVESVMSKRLLGLVAVVLLALAGLGCAVAGGPASSSAPVVAVDMGRGQVVCVYEGAEVPVDQECDVSAVKYRDVAQAPANVQGLVRAIRHVADAEYGS